MNFSVGDKILICTGDYGLTYFKGTTQTIVKIVATGLIFRDNATLTWHVDMKDAVLVTPLIEALG